MSLHPFCYKRVTHDPYSIATSMAVGGSLTWHSTDESCVPSAALFTVVRLATGWRLEDPQGQLVGAFASFDAARDAGFQHVEKTEAAHG